jgi:hypothetical protein
MIFYVLKLRNFRFGQSPLLKFLILVTKLLHILISFNCGALKLLKPSIDVKELLLKSSEISLTNGISTIKGINVILLQFSKIKSKLTEHECTR